MPSPSWLAAFRPCLERDDFRITLKTPVHMPARPVIQDLPAVFLRFPRWTGASFSDDFGRKSAAMVELDGEHLFPELAVLRLLERDGWSGRWVNTYGKHGEIWKYLTEWRDVPRDEQRNRVIEEDEPRQLLTRIATLNKPARFKGCWDVFAWRGSEYAFFEVKKGTPAKPEETRKEQEDWLRSALYVGDNNISLDCFCYVLWDFAAASATTTPQSA